MVSYLLSVANIGELLLSRLQIYSVVNITRQKVLSMTLIFFVNYHDCDYPNLTSTGYITVKTKVELVADFTPKLVCSSRRI